VGLYRYLVFSIIVNVDYELGYVQESEVWVRNIVTAIIRGTQLEGLAIETNANCYTS